MISIPESVRVALEPDPLALAKFLRPYATDERLWRIARQDSLGDEQYFADYRAYFDTFAPAPGRDWVDDEAARYTHYDIRKKPEALSREDAIHVALSGALALWRVSFSGWEYISIGSLLWAARFFPEMRRPLLSMSAHLAPHPDTDVTEAPFFMTGVMVCAAGIERLACDEVCMAALNDAMLLAEKAGAEVGMGSKLQEHRWLHRANNFSGDEEVALWAAIAGRDLPGPHATGATRDVLLALRDKLTGADAFPRPFLPDLDALIPALFDDALRARLAPDVDAFASVVRIEAARISTPFAVGTEAEHDGFSAYLESGVPADSDATSACRHLVYCALRAGTPFGMETPPDIHLSLCAAHHLLRQPLNRPAAFNTGFRDALAVLMHGLPRASEHIAPARRFLAALAERYPYPDERYELFREQERASRESEIAHILTVLVMLAAWDKSFAGDDALMRKLLGVLSRAESSVARRQLRYRMESGVSLPWLHRTVYISDEEVLKESDAQAWTAWGVAAESLLPGPYAKGDSRDALMRLKILLTLRTRVPADFVFDA